MSDPGRQIRIPDDLWAAFGTAAKRQSPELDRSAVVRELIRRYVRESVPTVVACIHCDYEGTESMTPPDLVTWLREQIDEDAADALAVEGDGHWDVPSTGVLELGGVEDLDGLVTGPRMFAYHAARYDPARALREVEAKRRVIDRWEIEERAGPPNAVDDVLRALALPYADRPGYREEWRP